MSIFRYRTIAIPGAHAPSPPELGREMGTVATRKSFSAQNGATNEYRTDYHRPSDSGLSDLGLAGIPANPPRA